MLCQRRRNHFEIYCTVRRRTGRDVWRRSEWRKRWILPSRVQKFCSELGFVGSSRNWSFDFIWIVNSELFRHGKKWVGNMKVFSWQAFSIHCVQLLPCWLRDFSVFYIQNLRKGKFSFQKSLSSSFNGNTEEKEDNGSGKPRKLRRAPHSDNPRDIGVPKVIKRISMQVSEEIEVRVTENVSQEFRLTKNRILGALYKLGEIFIKLQVSLHSGNV